MSDSNKQKLEKVNKLLSEIETTLIGLDEFKEQDYGSNAKRNGIEFHKSVYQIKLKLLGAEAEPKSA